MIAAGYTRKSSDDRDVEAQSCHRPGGRSGRACA